MDIPQRPERRALRLGSGCGRRTQHPASPPGTPLLGTNQSIAGLHRLQEDRTENTRLLVLKSITLSALGFICCGTHSPAKKKKNPFNNSLLKPFAFRLFASMSPEISPG